MKASTLITALNGIIAEKGDVEVLVSSDPEGNGYVGFGPDANNPLQVMWGNMSVPEQGWRRDFTSGEPRTRGRNAKGAVVLFPAEQIDPEF